MVSIKIRNMMINLELLEYLGQKDPKKKYSRFTGVDTTFGEEVILICDKLITELKLMKGKYNEKISTR